MIVTRWVIRRKSDGMYLNQTGVCYGAKELKDAGIFPEHSAVWPNDEEVIPVSVTISPLGTPGGARERVIHLLDVETSLEQGKRAELADRILDALDAAPRPVEEAKT